MFYAINDYWNDNIDTGLLYNDDTIRQADDEAGEREFRYVTNIQDGYTVEQSVQEGYESDTEARVGLKKYSQHIQT